MPGPTSAPSGRPLCPVGLGRVRNPDLPCFRGGGKIKKLGLVQKLKVRITVFNHDSSNVQWPHRQFAKTCQRPQCSRHLLAASSKQPCTMHPLMSSTLRRFLAPLSNEVFKLNAIREAPTLQAVNGQSEIVVCSGKSFVRMHSSATRSARHRHCKE